MNSCEEVKGIEEKSHEERIFDLECQVSMLVEQSQANEKFGGLLNENEGLKGEILNCNRDLEELQEDKRELEKLAFDLGKEKEMLIKRNEELLAKINKSGFLNHINEYFGYEIQNIQQFERELKEDYHDFEQLQEVFNFLYHYERKLSR